MPNINLSKDQYLELLKAVHAWAMMEEALNESEGKKLDQHEYKLNDSLLNFASEFGLTKYDINARDWADSLFEESFEMIDEYSKKEMWENLAWDLAEIKYVKKYGSKIESHSQEQSFLLRGEIHDEFLDEFISHGLENVRIEL